MYLFSIFATLLAIQPTATHYTSVHCQMVVTLSKESSMLHFRFRLQ